MSIMDSVINKMKWNEDSDEEYEYDDEYEDEEDEEEEVRPRKSLFSKPEPEEDDYDDEEDEPKAQPIRPFKSRKEVKPVRQTKRGEDGMEVCVIKPVNVEDARTLTDTLLAGRTVVLNLEGLEMDLAQRIIDFASGSTYAIKGNLQKISHCIFILTPASVDISGDFQDIISGSFDVPSINVD